jgi:hypothetical protein
MVLFVFILCLFLLPFQAFSQSLTLHETFTASNQCWSETNKTLDEAWSPNGGCYSYSFCVVDDACGGSNKVFRSRIVVGDHNGPCDPPWDSPAGSAGCQGPSPYYDYKHRAEIIESNSQGGDTRPDINQNFWLGWRLFIPSNYPNPGNIDIMVSQLIDVDGGADGTDWALRITKQGTFEDEQRTTAANGSSPNGSVSKEFGSAIRGKWHNFILHQRRGTTNGRHRLWYNGVLQQDYTGRTTGTTTPNAWWKFGAYKGCISTSFSGKTYDIYFDDVKVAYGTSDSQDLRSLVGPTTSPGVCGSTPPPPEPPTDPGLPPVTSNPMLSESCTVSQQPGTNGIVIVPDNQANLETAVETNTSKTILVRQGNYEVDNFQIGQANVVKPYNCGLVQVVMNSTSDNTITADGWTIAGLRFFCKGLDRDCFLMTTADGWTMRHNHIIEIMRGGPHIRGNSTGGLLDGNTFESCPSCVQGNMVTVGSILDPGGVGCTGEPCLYGNSPSNVTIRNNTFTGAISPGNTGGGGNHMLAIDGYSKLGLEIYDNIFKNPHNFWSAISFTNNWLRPGNALNGSANVHHNTIYGPMTGAAISGGPNGPAIYLQDAVGCKAANDCPNHRIHHNYIRDSYTTDTSSDGRKLSGAFKGHSSRYATATIEHNIDDNNNNIDDRETEAVHGLIFRQNTFYVSAFRFQNEVCTDSHTADNLVFDKNAFYNSEIRDLCTGSPDWLISNNVIGAAPATFSAGHLDSGNTTTVVSFGNVSANTEDFTITTVAESQKGALPVPVMASAVIGDNCSLDITMTPFNANGHNHGPISSVNTSRITVKYNGVRQTISSANIAVNVIKVKMDACPAGADTVTFDTVHGWCQDSADVGGAEKHMNAKCLAVTGQSVTNNVTGGGPPAPSKFYIDASCVTNGDGTTQTCGATGPWNSFKAAMETAGCAGMEPGSILEVKGDASLDLTCEGVGTNCYFENDVQVAAGCSGVIVQNAANEHVVVDGTMDIQGSTWTSIGSGVYKCAASGCSGGVDDVFAHRAWYNRGAGAETLDLIQSNQVCDTTLAAGKMRINQSDQSICVKLSNSTSPASASYFRVPWNSPFINGIVGNASNVTFRKNPSGSGTFHVQRYRKNIIELDAPSNVGWRIDGLQIHDAMSRCLTLSGGEANAGLKVINNTISFCGQEAIRVTGDTAAFEISGNTITDIQTSPYIELCSEVGTGCLSGMSGFANGIRVTNNAGQGGDISGNTLLRIGGGFNGEARGIDLNERAKSITVENNYIAHMSNLPRFGSGIILSGSEPGVNNGNVIYNNRVYDADICFNWLSSGFHGPEYGTTNYLINNTCSEPTVFGLRATWEGFAFLDGTVIVENNIFSATASVPVLLVEVPATQSEGWTTLNNNVFECDNCALKSPCEDEGGCNDIKAVISWGGALFGASEACEAGINCVADISDLGPTFNANVYGNINVTTSPGTEPTLQFTAPSIALDAGKTVSFISTDYLGTTRPRGSAFDAGAFESAGSTTFVLTQKSFRFYAGRSEDGVSPVAAENTNTPVFASSTFSLRFAIVASGGDAPPINLSVWARKCDPSCGTWTLVDDAADATVGVYLVDNPARSNLELINNGLTLGSNVFDAESKAIDALPNAITSSIVTNKQFEAEYHLGVSSGVSEGDTVEMRVEYADGTDLGAYTATPVITVSSARAKYYGGSWR